MRCWRRSEWVTGLPSGQASFRWITAAAILSSGLATTSRQPVAHAAETRSDGVLSAGREPVIWVRAVFVAAGPIPKTTIQTVQAEVDRVWNRYAVRIRWLVPDSPIEAGPKVVVIVGGELSALRADGGRA